MYNWTMSQRLIALLLVATVALCSCGGAGPAVPPTAAKPSATKPVSDIDFFADIKQQRKDAIRKTDWEKYRDEKLIGQRIHWEGYVIFVIEETDRAGFYEIRIELDPKDTLLLKHFDAFFFVPKDEAAAFTKGQELVLDGDIVEIKELGGSVDLVLTVHLENVIVQP